MEAKDIVSFATDACAVIQSCQAVINAQQAKLEEQDAVIRKQASAEPEVKMSRDGLIKAANAVYDFYGRPANLNPDSIVEYWSAKPESVLSTIEKMASVHATRIAQSEAEIGHSIDKKASAADEVLSADEAFRRQYASI